MYIPHSLMHVPINIPSLSMSTKRDVDMNKEVRFIAHNSMIYLFISRLLQAHSARIR